MEEKTIQVRGGATEFEIEVYFTYWNLWHNKFQAFITNLRDQTFIKIEIDAEPLQKTAYEIQKEIKTDTFRFRSL